MVSSQRLHLLKRQLFIKMLRTIWSFFCVPCFDSAPSSLPTSMLQPMNHYIFTIIYFHKATEGSLLTAKKRIAEGERGQLGYHSRAPSLQVKRGAIKHTTSQSVSQPSYQFSHRRRKICHQQCLFITDIPFLSVEAYRDKNSLGQSSFRSQDRSLESPV